MFIDVIIPTFNRSSLLNRSIESVLNQSYQHFNVIVIDDGSTDGTSLLMSQYSEHPKIRYLIKENGGVSSARNLGIKNARSEWICFLDSDDEWLPHKLQTQINYAHDNPQQSFIHSNEMWFRNGVRINAKKKFDKSSQDLFKRSLETCLISPSTVMMKKSLLERYGSFDESFTVCEDYDLWLKILAHQEVGFIDQYLVKKYGGHEDQLSTKYPAMDFWRIRSMINLLKNDSLSEDKKKWIHEEIDKKAPILLKGLLKHENQQGHKELTELLEFRFWR